MPRANRAAPIVDNQIDFVDAKLAYQLAKVRDMVFEPVRVFLRLVRQPTADMVGNDHAMGGAQGGDQAAIIERPGRVAMDHQNNAATAFIDIINCATRNREPVLCEWVQRTGRAKIEQSRLCERHSAYSCHNHSARYYSTQSALQKAGQPFCSLLERSL